MKKNTCAPASQRVGIKGIFWHHFLPVAEVKNLDLFMSLDFSSPSRTLLFKDHVLKSRVENVKLIFVDFVILIIIKSMSSFSFTFSSSSSFSFSFSSSSSLSHQCLRTFKSSTGRSSSGNPRCSFPPSIDVVVVSSQPCVYPATSMLTSSVQNGKKNTSNTQQYNWLADWLTLGFCLPTYDKLKREDDVNTTNS